MAQQDDRTRETARARGSAILATARLTLLFLVTLGYHAVFLVRRAAARDATARLAAGAESSWRWARVACRLLGVRVTTAGPPPPPGSLIAPNHFTWLDVIVLMGAQPSFFVSREDVQRWPVAGFFTRQIGTIFLRRSRAGRDLIDAAQAVRRRLDAGQSVVIFLEGTTAGGLEILPFKPSLVQTAIDAGAMVVPTALRWKTCREGVDLEEDVGYFRPHQRFAQKAWRMLGLKDAVACEIVYGHPIATAGRDRKELAQEIEAEVRRLYKN